MAVLLSIYSKKSFRELVLPPINNADYQVVLESDYFELQEDIIIHFEIINGIWRIKRNINYRIEKEDHDWSEKEIQDNYVLRLMTRSKDILSILVSEKRDIFHGYQKYDLSRIERIVIGKDSQCDIIYNYLNLISRVHAVLSHNGREYSIENKSPNGIYINSFRVVGTHDLKFGDYINIMGLHIVFLGNVLAIDDHNDNLFINKENVPLYEKEQDGTMLMNEFDYFDGGNHYYHRAPRNIQQFANGQIDIEEPPGKRRIEQQSFLLSIGPSISMALPMLLGCVLMVYASKQTGGASLYMYSGLIMSVSSALVGSVWTLVNMREQKIKEKKDNEYRFKAYSEYLIERAKDIKELYDKTRNQLNSLYPSVDECLEYNDHNGSLWNRNQSHSDFLSQRLGVGDVPFQVEISVPKKRFHLYKDELNEKPQYIKDNFNKLYNVPVTIDLQKYKIVGIVGGNNRLASLQILQVLSAQLAANNCYTDVKLCYIYNQLNRVDADNIRFAKWLPHTWSGDRKTRYIADSKETSSEILYELTKIFRSRDIDDSYSESVAIPRPYYVVFISDMSMLEGELFSKYIFSKERNYGLTTVLMAERYEDLPNNCEYIIQNTEEFQGMYGITQTTSEKIPIQFDYIQLDKLENFSRNLSGIQVVELEEGGEIPDNITFFDMLGIKGLADLKVMESWTKNRTYDNIRGLLGQKAGGVPCYLDVHEKYHGPHGLVAGTTGSGKSETLQTYLLSLAINYSPDDIGFFIIDYKGGGMANLFDGLPHMIGQISNLSGNQVKRAMISIKSENKRRQRIFNENGVNNINSYTQLYKNGETDLPIPHLFIIIDEFAELKREEPEFMKELISVAQVGRSLGVHLILATQRPSGTVDDNIWSNSKFRLCLRVQDRQDSNDMLHKPDAAYITQAGRGFLQVGNDEVYEQFQSGFSGATYNAEAKEDKEIAMLLTLSGKVEISSKKIKALKHHRIQDTKKKEVTQLEAVKRYLALVAQKNGFLNQHQLWMPELSDCIYLDEFEGFKQRIYRDGKWISEGRAVNIDIIVGKVDDPENQSQFPLKLNFLQMGHVAVIGNVVTGKSVMLQTMIYALIQQYTPRHINIYGIDFSSKMMEAFVMAPQVGGIMFENDIDKIGKFFNMMEDILQDRKKLFRGGNYIQYLQKNGLVCPAVFVFIDNYAAFKEKTDEKYEDIMIRLSKEGVNHGIYLVVSGGGFGMSEITSRVGENIDTVLCLNMQDRFAYADVLHTMQIDVLPDAGVKGRGLAKIDDRVLEYQTALAVDAENDYDRLDRINEQCVEMSNAWVDKTARRIPEIPQKPTWSEFKELEQFENMSSGEEYLPVGYDYSNASVYGVSLYHTYCYLITGMARSGKTNFIKVCIQSALEKEAKVCIIDSPAATLKSYHVSEAVQYATTESEIFELFKVLLDDFKIRNQLKNQLLEAEYDEEEIFERMCREIPYFIFISDLAWFVPFIYSAEMDMRGFLENIIEKGRLHNIYFFGELSWDKRDIVSGYALYELFAGYGTGIHFGGNVSNNTAMDFGYIPYTEQMQAEKPGIGQIPATTDVRVTRKIVVPLARK